MLKVNNLEKSFKKLKALKGISFHISSGEIVGILGPNGAGKSTTIKLIAGLLRPSNGDIRINNKDNKSVEAKKSFAYIPEIPQVYDYLTVDEHMAFIANAYGIKSYEEKANYYFGKFDLTDKRDKLGKELSKGMKQKVSICCGLLTDADLFLFDEPMIGIDPKAIKELKLIFKALAEEEKSILISTHLLDSIEAVCDRVLILKEGEIVINETMEDFKQRNGKDVSLEDVFLEVTNESI